MISTIVSPDEVVSPRIICFDLEGPLSPQDNAYEVMALTYNGDRVFEVISRYDDYLTLRRRAGYEPGDTLALIAPFLINYGITDDDIRRVSSRAKIVDGSRELISMLKRAGWKVYIISTSYEQHAYNIGARLGVPRTNIRCTKLNLRKLRWKLTRRDIAIIIKAKRDILELYPHINDEAKIVERLDEFYFKELQNSDYGNVLEKVRVVGGEKKVEALKDIVKANHGKLKETIVVGDSITDYKMLDCARKEGGIAIVFNGNEYAVPYANVGLASTDIRFIQILANAFATASSDPQIWETIKIIVETWEDRREQFINGDIPRELVTTEIREFLYQGDLVEFPYFSFLKNTSEEKIAEVLKIHKRFRALVRGAAAKLG